MNVSLIYLHVVSQGYKGAAPPEYYLPFSKRWVKTYMRFRPRVSHNIRIVCCGSSKNDIVEKTYEGFECEFDTYIGEGSDIGACQHAIKNVDADFVVCMSTPVYFWMDGWLERLIEARELYGDGIYGPMASYEASPHIRTSCWCVDPKTFILYPHLIDTREKCCWAESNDHNGDNWQISTWYKSIGKPTMMVASDSIRPMDQWRTPDNVFRRGDQSNCIIRDQHVDVYDAAHYHERLELEARADGKRNQTREDINKREDSSHISEDTKKV